jgi:hypothetical protein
LIRVIALACIISAATRAAPAGQAAPGPWEILFTASGRDQWLTAVWPRRDGAWIAGGKNVLVSGKDDAAKVTAIPGTVVYRFGEDSTGRVVAVGLRAMIWEQEGEGFRLVHQSHSPLPKGRAAYGDLLYGIGHLDPSSTDTLMAFGPSDLIAYRLPDGTWETKRDPALASWAQTGPPKATLPPGCQRLYWHWLERNEAFLLCHDSRAFLVSNDVPRAAGRLPAACKDDVYAVSRDQNDLYLSCGSSQKLWRQRGYQPSWTQVQGAPSGVRDMVVKEGCLTLVTGRQVWRQCRTKIQ